MRLVTFRPVRFAWNLRVRLYLVSFIYSIVDTRFTRLFQKLGSVSHALGLDIWAKHARVAHVVYTVAKPLTIPRKIVPENNLPLHASTAVETIWLPRTIALRQWSQRNALFKPISEATPTVLPTTVQRSAAEPPSARVTLCLRSVLILKIWRNCPSVKLLLKH